MHLTCEQEVRLIRGLPFSVSPCFASPPTLICLSYSRLPLSLLCRRWLDFVLKVEEIKGALNKAREAGIQNILALRGDPAKGACSAR